MSTYVTLISAVAGTFAIIAGVGAFVRWVEPKLKSWRVRRTKTQVNGEAEMPQATTNARQATAKKELGKLHRQSGEYEDAERLFTEALDDFVGLKNAKGQANALMNRGILFRMMGRFQRAERDHAASDELYRLAGDRRGCADNLKNWGRVYYDLGDARKAIEIHERSLKIYESIRDTSGTAELNQQLAIDYSAVGDMASARQHMDRAPRSS